MGAQFAVVEPWTRADEECERIARLVRGARLTILQGRADSGASASSIDPSIDRLLPYLQRRVTDWTAANARRDGTVARVEERRADAFVHDIVVPVDARHGAPLRSLSERVDAALFERFGTPPDAHVPDVAFGWLAEKLGAASRESHVRFLIVLDAFDELLANASDDAARTLFTDELVETLNAPGLAVHVLAIVCDEARPELAKFRARITEAVALPIEPAAGFADRPPGLRAVPAAASSRPSASDPVGIASLRTEGPDPIAPACHPSFAATRPPTSTPRIAAAGVALLCAAGGWLAWSNRGAPEAPRESVAARAQHARPTAAPAAPSRPVLAIAVDPDSALDARIAAEMRDRVADDAGIDLRVRPATSWTDGFAAPAAGPQLSILRYDALQAARQGGVIAPLRVVMPLYAEPIQVLARRDAPFTFVHELEGRRINVGPEQGARAVTAARLYRELFGKPLAAADADVDDARTALAKLVADQGIDALVVVGGVDALVDALPPASKARLKLLRLDIEEPASRRAQRTFLTTVARAGTSGGLLAQDAPALAAMAFLVASGAFEPADDARLGAFAGRLCARLPALQRDGHPKWREARTGARVDVGWPYAAASSAAFDRCQASDAGAS